MSKIALTPNASGTGTFTLAAPNSNTSRTITLPDEAGEVLVNTATGVDVTGTLTSDGLTVDAIASSLYTADATLSNYATNNGVYLNGHAAGWLGLRADGTGSTRIDQYGSSFGEPDTIKMFTGSSNRLRIQNNGDISFYEDTGTTPKFFWDASAESLGLSNLKLYSDNVRNEGGILYVGTSGNYATQFYNNDANTVHISGAGNVGIGTDSPNRLLSLYATQPVFQITNVASGNTQGTIQYQVSGSTQFNIDNQGSGSGGVIAFMQAGTERMRIDSGGNILIGATSVSSVQAGTVDGVSLRADSGARFFSRDSTDARYQISFMNPNGSVGRIETSGSSTSYVTSSDYRLKTDAQPMTGASARVQALNPVNFEWIADGTRVDGFLAHEAQEVVPEAVSGTKDAMRDEEYEVTPAVYEDVVIPAVLDEEGNELEAERTEQQLVTEAVMGTRSVPDYQGIDQSKLVPLLTAALQEALTEISDLKARVTALEAV